MEQYQVKMVALHNLLTIFLRAVVLAQPRP
jgi:hypothetical protein